MNITIIGLGLLGGSYALSLRDKYPKMLFSGIDVSEVNGRLAVAKGIVDKTGSLETLIPTSDLVILAIPVDKILEVLPKVLDLLPDYGTVIDLGSTKELICALADQHPKRSQFVAAHPMAGTENSGPSAAFKDLLPHRNVIICDKEKSNANSLVLAESLFRDIGMKIHYMTPAEHDLHLAYVSHLSHVLSFALGVTVLEKEKDERNIFAMAGTGFGSTVRLAKSSPAMWTPIFDHNRKNVIKATSDYIEFLQQFKQILENEDNDSSNEFINRANEIRRVLAGIEKK